MSYVDFLLRGIISMNKMMSSINSAAATTCVNNRSKGIFRKLAANPMPKLEQNASHILKLTVTLLLALAVSLSVAWILFQATPQINAIMMILIVGGSVLFAGLSILLTAFIKTSKWQ